MKDKGFTLIELLVVVAIIGILAAIAIPQFAAYRQRGFDARAESDVRNFATAEEAYFASFETYTTATTPPGYKQSAAVTIGTPAPAGGGIGTGFSVTATSKNGTTKIFTFDSTSGKITS